MLDSSHHISLSRNKFMHHLTVVRFCPSFGLGLLLRRYNQDCRSGSSGGMTPTSSSSSTSTTIGSSPEISSFSSSDSDGCLLFFFAFFFFFFLTFSVLVLVSFFVAFFLFRFFRFSSLDESSDSELDSDELSSSDELSVVTCFFFLRSSPTTNRGPHDNLDYSTSD